MALANLLSVCWVVRQEGGHMEHYLLVFVDRVHTLFASLSILAVQSTTISDNETIVRIILNVHNYSYHFLFWGCILHMYYVGVVYRCGLCGCDLPFKAIQLNGLSKQL